VDDELSGLIVSAIHRKFAMWRDVFSRVPYSHDVKRGSRSHQVALSFKGFGQLP